MPPPRVRLTHFLCLPLVTSASRSQWQASLKKILDDLNGTDSPALCPEMIRPLGTLHITIGVMLLPTPELEQAACAMLHSDEVARHLRESMKPNITKTVGTFSTNNDKNNDKKEKEVTQHIDPTVRDASLGSLPTTTTTTAAAAAATCPAPILPLTTSFSGLQAMGSPTLTSILFVPPADPESRIRQLYVSVQSVFQAANLMIQENRPIQLHATILNTIYASKGGRQPQGSGSRSRSGPGSKAKRVWKKHFKFDATEMLKRYAGSEWASNVRLEKLSLCRMGARKVVENGEMVDEEYKEVDYVPLFAGD